MFDDHEFSKAAFLLAACLGASFQGLGQRPQTPVCTGPASLETRLHAHPDAEAYAALGIWFDQNHHQQCALDTFHSGLNVAPGSAHLYFLLGQSLYSAGLVQESVTPLHQAVRLDPGGLPAHLLLGTVLTKLGRNREAADQWKVALEIDPGSNVALDGLARQMTASGDYDAAIRLLSSAPRDETLTLGLAIAYRKAGMYDEAAKVLSDGVESMPDSDALTAALVSLDVDKSHFESASVLAEKIAERKPEDLEAQRIYLRTLVVTGNNQAAALLGRKLLALAPHDADLLNLNGLLEQKAGDLESARKDLEEAVTLNPNDYNPRVNLGVVLADLKDPAGARKQLEKAIALGTDEPQVHFELAKVLRTLGETQAAQEQLAIYQKRLKEESDQAEAVSKATEAAEAIKAGDNRKAADLYREACAAQPENAALDYRLAMVLESMGDAEGERAALAQAIRANPRFAQAQYQLGYMDFQAGNNASAEREFRATVEALPNNVQAWISLAATLGAESRLDEARAAIGHALQLQPDNTAARALSERLDAAQRNDRGQQH